MKKVILFDIDYTLFDTKRFIKASISLIGDMVGSQNKEEFFKNNEKILFASKNSLGSVDPTLYIKNLVSEYKAIDSDVLHDLFFNPQTLEKYLYPEVIDLFKTLSRREDVIIGIFSTGEATFQHAKIGALRVYIDPMHIHIHENKKEHISSLFKDTEDTLYVVDDRFDVLEAIKKENSQVTTIGVKLSAYSHSENIPESSFIPDFTVQEIEEIGKIIDK